MSEYSISAALDAWDEMRRKQHAEEESETPARGALDDYAGFLTSTSHPPQECGDPFSCPACGELFRSYHGEEARDD